MTDIPLYLDDDEVPTPRDRADLRFENVTLQPYGDGRRVKLSFRVLPFLERPNVEAVVLNPAGQAVASLSLIEAMDQDFDFTLHLRGPQPTGLHTLRLILYYPQDNEPATENWQVVDEYTGTFEVPAPY